MLVEIVDETNQVPMAYQELVERVIVHAAKFLELPNNRECDVTFVSSERIREINKEYRGKDQVTDVISFALDDEEDDIFSIADIAREDENFVTVIGDILISVDRAKEQAEDYGHSLDRELGFLALHGFLHLNGYDHQTREEESEMNSLQEEILESYGLKRDK